MDQFHRERRAIIGGSDAPIVMGLSPYKSPYTLYLEKAGLTEPEPKPDNGPLYFGKVLEPILMNELKKREGINNIEYAPPLILDKEFSFLGAHLDGRIPGTSKIIEAKTTSPFKRDDWGEPGTDNIPDYYILQCQHNMRVAEAELCFVPVLVGGSDYRTYRVKRNEGLIHSIVDAEVEFWERVKEHNPPDPDGSESSTEALKKLYPTGTGEIISPTGEILDILHELRAVKTDLKMTERQRAALENQIKKFMRDATIMPVDGVVKGKGVQWIPIAGAKMIDWKGAAEYLIKWMVEQGFSKRDKLDSMIENSFTKTKASYRRFVCNFEE